MAGPEPRLARAPVLSTTDTRIFEDATQAQVAPKEGLSDDELYVRYEIPRTIREIREGRWKRVALQFEDQMLGHAVRVFEALERGLENQPDQLNPDQVELDRFQESSRAKGDVKLFILADTSYGACCVDEIAAEHVDAEVVVHYGRSCLSRTARLPVIYVFTTRPIDLSALIDVFTKSYSKLGTKVILLADVPYQAHVNRILAELRLHGYDALVATSIVHDPSAVLPNRRLQGFDEIALEDLKEFHVFHLGQPPAALLLTLASRVASVNVYSASQDLAVPGEAAMFSSTLPLRRRYGLIASLSTCSIFGILINTLSVKNYLHIIRHIQQQIERAGKKSYTFVVGKVNAAKIANFAEIGAWVVIGCWESSLVESNDFYKPLITPFELGIVLRGDKNRIWTGEWKSDFEAVLVEEDLVEASKKLEIDQHKEAEPGEYDSEEESAPPEFDLRTGRYVARARPLRGLGAGRSEPLANDHSGSNQTSSALIKRTKGDIAQVGAVASPGAEFLRSNRTWQGLGSDLEVDYTHSVNGTAIEQGRSGVARGYTVGDDETRR